MEVKTTAVNGLKSASRMMLQDLEALPEDAYFKCFGGKARTVADLVYEVNLVNDHVGMVIRGEDAFEWPEGWLKAPAELNTKQAVVDAFKASSQRIIATAEGFTEAQFEEKIVNDGNETTRFERCRFMTLHVWYHSGQLNFMQTLLGDDGWHWA